MRRIEILGALILTFGTLGSTAHAQSAPRCLDIFSDFNYEASLVDLQARIYIEGESPMTLHSLFEVHLSGRRLEAALDVVNENLRRYPEDVIALFNKSRVLYSLKRYNQAELLVSRLLQLSPKNEDYLELKALLEAR